MVGMTDIVQFLAARLDEDEAAAVRAARPEPWVKPQPSRPNWYVQFWADEQDRAVVIADPESSAYPVVATLGYDGNDEADEELAEGRVEHIARHNPARVLAEVKGKRAIIEAHEKFGLEAALVEHKGYDALNYHRNQAMAHALNVVLRYLALAYADHPDFDPAWRVPTT